MLRDRFGNEIQLARSTVYRCLVASLLLVLLAFLIGWMRMPAVEADFIDNQDIAGITYNADLLRGGGVPYVDNVEVKAPGSYFATWGIWALWGRSVRSLQIAGVVMAILAAFGMCAAAGIAFGWTSGLLAALLYALVSPISDSMTVNYNAWKMAPYIWSTAFFIAGLRWGRLGWFMACGASLALAALCKRQAGVVFPAYVVVLLFWPYFTAPSSWARPQRWRALGGLVCGLGLGFTPIMLFYLAQGKLVDFVLNYFLSSHGWRYLAGELGWQTKFELLEDGVWGLWEFALLPAVLAAMTLASLPLRHLRGGGLILLLFGGLFGFGFVGVSLGFRFYQSYYLQTLPALVWLAVHPSGPLMRFQTAWCQLRRGSANYWASALAQGLRLLIVLPVVAAAAFPTLKRTGQTRARRSQPNLVRSEVRRVAEVVRKNTRPNERIWVWGRWAWPVYFYANRMSVTRYYKVLGIVTNNLDNTWRRPCTMTRFATIGPYRELGRELVRHEPPFIVTSNNEDYTGFEAFEQLLARRYRRVSLPGVRAFRLWKRNGPKGHGNG